MRPRSVESEVTVKFVLRGLQQPNEPSVGYLGPVEDVEIVSCERVAITGSGRELVELLDLVAPGWRSDEVWEDTAAIEKGDRAENEVESLGDRA